METVSIETEEQVEEKVEEKGEEKVEEKPPAIDPAVEERARIMGHVPKDEFKGDPERWISAEEYVERADTMMPILKSMNVKLERKYFELEKELKSQKELSQKMVKIHGKYSEDSHDARITDIKARKLKAVEDQDIELFKQLEDQESKIEKPEVVEIPEDNTVQKDSPEFVQWKEKNTWYETDSELAEYADIIANRMMIAGHSYSQSEVFDVVKDKVKKLFPDKFKNPKAKEGSGLDESETRGSEPTKTDKKTWADLPEDAKKQCANAIAEIPGFTKEKYLKDYYEEAE